MNLLVRVRVGSRMDEPIFVIIPNLARDIRGQMV